MKAFAIDRYKGDLVQRDLADPVAGPGEVLVDIHATSVNPIDVKIRADGVQLGEIAKLVDAGVIRPVVDRTFSFAETPAAMCDSPSA